MDLYKVQPNDSRTQKDCKPIMNILDTKYPNLARSISEGKIWIEEYTYLTIEEDGTIVQVGQIGEEKEIESWLVSNF